VPLSAAAQTTAGLDARQARVTGEGKPAVAVDCQFAQQVIELAHLLAFYFVAQKNIVVEMLLNTRCEAVQG
jgi:hypothetical protein